MKPDGLTVIIPTLNEEKTQILPQILSSIPKNDRIYTLVVDSGSTDRTLEVVKQYQTSVVHIKGQTRAERLSFGIQSAQTDMVLLQHPRSLLPSEAYVYLAQRHKTLNWGGFTHQFDIDHWLLNFTSFYSNRIRPKTSRILYLDHCIFLRKSLIEENLPLPEMDIFEDTHISRLLARSGPPEVLPLASVTSAIRFQTNGVYRQALMNQVLKVGYHLKLSPKWMNKIYEAGLQLNTSYDKGGSANRKDNQ